MLVESNSVSFSLSLWFSWLSCCFFLSLGGLRKNASYAVITHRWSPLTQGSHTALATKPVSHRGEMRRQYSYSQHKNERKRSRKKKIEGSSSIVCGKKDEEEGKKKRRETTTTTGTKNTWSGKGRPKWEPYRKYTAQHDGQNGQKKEKGNIVIQETPPMKMPVTITIYKLCMYITFLGRIGCHFGGTTWKVWRQRHLYFLYRSKNEAFYVYRCALIFILNLFIDLFHHEFFSLILTVGLVCLQLCPTCVCVCLKK